MTSWLSFQLLNTDYVSLNQHWNYHNVISPFYRLYLIDNGEGMLSNPEQNIKLEKGYLYLIPSFTLVNQTCESHLSQYYVHFFEQTPNGTSLFASGRRLFKVPASAADTELFKRLIEINPKRDLRKSDNPEVYEKSHILKSFHDANAHLPLYVMFETQGLIQILVSRFLQSGEYTAASRKIIPSKILDAINYIQTHMAQTITVEELAARANLSTDYFSRSFLAHTACRPSQYLNNKRVERAQFLMLTTNFTFTEIAEQTGFDSLSYFSRIFKSITGKTPGYYREHQVHDV